MWARVTRAALPVAALFCCGVVSLNGPTAIAVEIVESGQSVEALVLAALECEVGGDPQRRDALLQKALELDPDHRLARWHSGYVRAGDEWLSLEESQRRRLSDERLAEYRRRRESQAGTPAGELALARWCRSQKLEVEERIHWLRLLLFQPLHQEALKNLDMRWQGGQLLTAAQIQKQEAEPSQADSRRAGSPSPQHWARHWTPLLARWRRAIDDNAPDLESSLREALLAVEHDQGLEALDGMIQRASALKRDQEEAYRALSLKLVGVLDAVAEPWAMHSLSRHAVYHPMDEVRTAAADALARRPMESVVPYLLARMRWPTEASFVLITHPDGSVTYQHSFYREGLYADFLDTRGESTYLRSDAFYARRRDPTPRLAADDPTAWARAARASLKARAETAAKAAETQLRAEAAYARDERLNERIGKVLCRVTGAELQPHPKYWQAWWDEWYYDYYELETPRESSGEKPLYENRVVRTQHVDVTPRPSSSCFPQGTKVWTLTGPVGIEAIRPGDQVLSQHPVTGELTYKPVLQTTTRDPSPMIKLSLGSETIAATRGHPFWVAGEGWRMAKELAAGSPLHGLSGAVPLAAVEETPPAKAWYEFSYNLIVDDFHTYFVGDSRVLVHDNELFIHDQTTNPLPGLAAR